MDITIIGRRIRYAREALKMTQEDLALRLDTTSITVSRWELGKIYPRLQQFEKMEEVLKKPIYWFFMPEGFNLPSYDADVAELCRVYSQLNPTGKAKILSYANDLSDLVRYTQAGSLGSFGSLDH